jgi:RimJ/RimL family protein N-acetyltransferase
VRKKQQKETKMKSKIEIKTKRLTIRPVQIGDETEIHEYAGDKEITMMFWLPRDTFEETVDFVKRNAEQWDLPDQTNFEFVIIYDGKIIGGCDCDLGHSEDHSYATLGWIINKKYRKQGFASEAAAAVLDFAFTKTGINKVYAQCDCNNPASFGVMKKIGMKLVDDKGTRTYPKTGKTSGEFTCLITKEEWEKSEGK